MARSAHISRPARLALVAGSLAALALGAPLAAQDSATGDDRFATFAPAGEPIDHRIDYGIWDEAMRNLVISMGPSLRQSAGRPDPGFGTRRQYGHVSRYRLEGTRIMFSFLDADIIASFSEYRRDLESVAESVDIQSLSRNEQLAYWINLHNVAMVEQIALAWPVRQPRDIKIGGVPLDEARFITVEGIAMSPRDIREKIVYANWRDPRVIYAFWRGEIGSPSIQREAFNADNVSRLLERGARDFVNSLRGTQKRGDTLEVSDLYADVARFYFTDFDADLRAHLASHADEDTAEILAATSRIDASIAERDIADLAGGVREPSYTNITSDGVSTSFRIPQSMARLLAQREEKFQRVIRQGRTGTVTFSNIQLPGDAGEPGEVE
ncbi:DUF547 domain-containing protein [Qipengyuania nanhaisediminis]|uniref:DUF547 domain-containing protein n=1 Tax=Qipengyuania nanhaisediminis TaxID=604088 RepID=UPI0038B3044C